VSVAVVIACVVVRPSAPVGTMLAAPPLVWVGRRSYGVYILHLAVFWFLIQFEVGRMFGSMERRAESWIAVAVTVGAAAIAYRYIERPAIAIGRRITRR
jgi:peptidoglycan/LPS O-acetylase OafA/YrhL